jgi:ATP-dependent helicase/nuclease subunit A
VREVNAAFSPIMRAPEGGRRYQPDYEPLSAYRRAEDTGPGVVILPPAGSLGGKPKADDVRAAEAAGVAALVERIAGEGRPPIFDRENGQWRPPSLRDIAVLFHSTTGLSAYEDAFASYGLDYRIAGGKRFYVRREVIELRTTLTAVEDPHNLVAVVGALRTPFFGVSDEAIVLHRAQAGTLNYLAKADRGSPAVERAFALLRELHAERNAGSIADLLSKLFERTAALELFLLKPDGEQRHANLIKVVELASKLEKSEPMSFGGFVRWLREVSQLTPEEAESPLSEEGDEFVRMLTIHKSKGLEFPITILADLGRFWKGGTESLVVDREEALLAFGVGPKDDRLATRDYERLLEFEGVRREAELVRLLYVGATRARDLLVLPWFPAKEGDATGLLEHLGGFIEVGVGEPVADLKPSGRRVVRFDTGTLDLERRPPRPVRLDVGRARQIEPTKTDAYAERGAWERWIDGIGVARHVPANLIAPSSLAAHVDSEPVRDEEPAASAPSRGRELGTLVHAVMERVDLDDPETVADVTRAIARAAGLPDDLAPEASRIIERALDSPIVRRAVAAPRESREMPFCVSHEGATVEGKIDLAFEEDGEIVVVDYKTDDIKPGQAKEHSERYRGQAEAYALAMSEITGEPVKEIVLFFMRTLDEISITPPDDDRTLGDAVDASMAEPPA